MFARYVTGICKRKSADGEYKFSLYPATQFDWSDDPVYLDAMKRGFNLHSCHIAQQADAKDYISNMLAPSINAQVKSSKTIDELQGLMDAGASKQTQLARQAGNNAYSHKGSAAEGVLQFADGKEGLAFCTVMQTIVTMGGTQGQITNSYYCYVSMRMVLKYKSGNEAAARKIMSTLLAVRGLILLGQMAYRIFLLLLAKMRRTKYGNIHKKCMQFNNKWVIISPDQETGATKYIFIKQQHSKC